MYTIKRIFNPEIFQGKHKKNHYFEGWYFKLTDKTANNVIAVIPGVAISKNKEHAFIQFIDAKTGFSRYFNYPLSDFYYSENIFDIRIGNNTFSKYSIHLEIKADDFYLTGDVTFTNIISYPKSLGNPGIMGPFTFLPLMECRHGIVNINNELRGSLDYSGSLIDFTGGYGYVEKDWGKSFPHSWIWLQSNNFSRKDTSFMFSVASIPWLHREFEGLISFLKLEDSFLRFATYTGARIVDLKADKSKLSVSLKDSRHFLHIECEYAEGGLLKAPKKGLMEVEITESITSKVSVQLTDKSGRLLFEDIGNNTGLELVGNYKKFII